jgi:hypothetical protein
VNRDEIIDLLTVAAAFDQRTVGETDVVAWSAVLGKSGFAAARQAVISHYGEQVRRVMPADIRQHIRMNSRPDSVPFAELPAASPDEPNEAYLKAREDMVSAMAARDSLAMAANADAGERAAAWLDAHLKPGKPAGPPMTVSAADRWMELPGDPPEVRSFLAAQRRAAKSNGAEK